MAAPKDSFTENITALREFFTSVDSQFTRAYARRAFIHWYVDEGLDELSRSLLAPCRSTRPWGLRALAIAKRMARRLPKQLLIHTPLLCHCCEHKKRPSKTS